MYTVFCSACIYISSGSSELRLMFPRRLVIIARIVNAPASKSSSMNTQTMYLRIVMLCVGLREYLYIIRRLMATTVIPISTSTDDQTKYIVLLNPFVVIHCIDSNGLYMFMNIIANIDT